MTLKVVRPSSDRQLDADRWVRAVTDRDTQTRTPKMSLARIEQRFARIRRRSGDLLECRPPSQLSGLRGYISVLHVDEIDVGLQYPAKA
jgi:hypothetical protein